MLLRQTTVPTVIDSFYLLTLGSYRAFYIGNWIQRGITEENEPNPVSVIFGVIQTLFYIDFAWVYWTRQRVKLRNGAVVDSDDLKHGWLVNKLVRVVRTSVDIESPSGNERGNWGPRGISVSADGDLPADRSKASNGTASRRAMRGGAAAIPEETEGMLSAPDEFEDTDRRYRRHFTAVKGNQHGEHEHWSMNNQRNNGAYHASVYPKACDPHYGHKMGKLMSPSKAKSLMSVC